MGQQEMYEKHLAAEEAGIGKDGVLAPTQARRFLDMVLGEAPSLGTARVVFMPEATLEIARILPTKNRSRPKTEGWPEQRAELLTLRSVEIETFVERTVGEVDAAKEAQTIEAEIVRPMARQVALDLEELAWQRLRDIVSIGTT